MLQANKEKNAHSWHAESPHFEYPGTEAIIPEKAILKLHKNCRKPFHPFNDKEHLKLCRPSADMLLLGLDLFTTNGARGSLWKATNTTVTLSLAPRLIASTPNSRQHLFVSLCSWSLLLTKSTAIWFVNTSQRPSLPMIKNSSSFVKVTSFSSGSALKGPPPSTDFIPSMCQSPSARVTPNSPFKYPSLSMNPPRDITRLRSSKQSGLWSLDISIATPTRDNTARQSPALATSNDLLILPVCPVMYTLR